MSNHGRQLHVTLCDSGERTLHSQATGSGIPVLVVDPGAFGSIVVSELRRLIPRRVI